MTTPISPIPTTSLMGDLHFMPTPCTTSLHNVNLGDMSLVMDERAYSPLFFSSPLVSSDPSTGYLEDVLVELGSKRRRLMLCNNDYHYEWANDHLMESYWNSNSTWGQPDDVSTFNGVSSDEFGSMSSGSEEANVKTAEEAVSGLSQVTSANTKGEEEREREKRKTRVRVVYPFAVVKPGGVEGDVTLSDINKGILMRPTRPVRHPVGDYACRPRVSPEAPGISGKAVVALTTIQTHGNGTITIIRTKG